MCLAAVSIPKPNSSRRASARRAMAGGLSQLLAKRWRQNTRGVGDLRFNPIFPQIINPRLAESHHKRTERRQPSERSCPLWSCSGTCKRAGSIRRQLQRPRIMAELHGLGSCVRHPLAIRHGARRVGPPDSTLALPARPRPHLFFLRFSLLFFRSVGSLAPQEFCGQAS